MNNDGKTSGITVPNPIAQQNLIMSAWKDAGIRPDDVSYIEAHGTGTPIGDPIEIQGIDGAFKQCALPGIIGARSVRLKPTLAIWILPQVSLRL